MAVEVRDKRPGWLWADRAIIKRDGPRLGAYGIAVYMVLCAFAGEDQKAWPSKKTLADLVGCSKRQVDKALRKLEELGWVCIERRPTGEGLRHDTNVYYLLETPGGSAPHALPSSAPDALGVVHHMHGGSAPHAPEVEPLNESQENEEDKPPAAADPLPPATSLSFQDWAERLRESNDANGNTVAILMEMHNTLYSDNESPTYGRLGTCAKRVGGIMRFAQLLWEHSARPPVGAVCDYVEKMARSNGHDRRRLQRGRGNTGGKASAAQGDRPETEYQRWARRQQEAAQTDSR